MPTLSECFDNDRQIAPVVAPARRLRDEWRPTFNEPVGLRRSGNAQLCQFLDQNARLHEITAPTLITWRRDDRFVPMNVGAATPTIVTPDLRSSDGPTVRWWYSG